MKTTYTTINAARHRDADKDREHGPSGDVVTVWDVEGGRKLELADHELEEYEQAEEVLLDEDIIGVKQFDALLAWLREEDLLEDEPVAPVGAHGTVDKAQDAADLQLMAAAPELLNMLRRLLDEVTTAEQLPGAVAPLTVEHARAAIAKATGGAQ